MRRGQINSVSSVIGFVNLKDKEAIGSLMTPRKMRFGHLLSLDLQRATPHHGEILKFIGELFCSSFRSMKTGATTCSRPSATRQFLNADACAHAGSFPVQIALHYGEVLSGNIGPAAPGLHHHGARRPHGVSSPAPAQRALDLLQGVRAGDPNLHGRRFVSPQRSQWHSGGLALSAKHPTQNEELSARAMRCSQRAVSTRTRRLPPTARSVPASARRRRQRMSVVVRTAHPQLEMLVQRWHPSATEEISVDEVDTIAQHYANEHADGTTEVYLLKHGHSDQALYQKSPFAAVELSGSAQSWRLAEHLNPPRFPIFANLAQRSVTEYCASSSQPERITDAHLDDESGRLPQRFPEHHDAPRFYLRLSVAHKLERIDDRVAVATLPGTAQQVAAGRIRHGDLQSLGRRSVLSTCAGLRRSRSSLRALIGPRSWLLYGAIDRRSPLRG